MVATIDSLFLSALRKHPDRPFMRKVGPGKDETITYREASIRIARTVQRLQELGYRRGDTVACYLDDMESWIFFALSASNAGLVMLCLGSYVSPEATLRLRDRVRAHGVFTTPQIAPRLIAQGVRPACYAGAGEVPAGVDALDRGPQPSADEALRLISELAPLRAPEALYQIAPTSGTTGEPKMVTMGQAYLYPVGLLFTGHAPLPEEPQERVLMVCSLAHGLGHILLAATLGAGAQFSLPAGIDAQASLEEIWTLAPTHVMCPPRVLRSLQNQAVAAGKADRPLLGPSCRILRVGGAPPDLALLSSIAGQGVDVGESYGSAEVTGASATPLGGWRPGWAGKPLPGSSVRIAEDGEILFKSPYVFSGYFEDEAATRAVFTEDGYVKTGDFGELSSDGHLRVLGRKKDVFNTFDGTNIYPVAIETLIEGFPSVHQVALVGDVRPYLLALIVLAPQASAGAVTEPDGFLDEQRNPAAYAAVREQLMRMNERQERVERVRRFALFTRPMGPELFATPGAIQKVRRNRPAIVSAYSARIDALYAAPPGTAGWVPGE